MIYFRFFIISFIFFSSSFISCKSQSSNHAPQPSSSANPQGQERCSSISAEEKTNPVTRLRHEFFDLAEDVNRFRIERDQSVYVIGDIHGSWEMIRDALIHAEIMELDPSPEKTVEVRYQRSNIRVTIPNLRFRSSIQNKVIFVGDYIAKTSREREQITLGLLKDILQKQQHEMPGLVAGQEPVVAIFGNHDFEAVNGVDHSSDGYPTEKHYEDQVRSMLDLLVPTYVYNGIWYSHSYLTDYDMDQFHQLNPVIGFQNIRDLGDLGQLFNLSGQVNQFIHGLITSQQVHTSWLGSEAVGDRANFMYAMRTTPADGALGPMHGPYQKFPMIMGHLSDLQRKEIRVLSEGYYGHDRNEYPRRSHILCVDTSIYHSTLIGSRAKYLKINYRSTGASRVDFQACSLPTR